MTIQASDDLARFLARKEQPQRLSFNPESIAAVIAGFKIGKGVWLWSPDAHNLRKWPRPRD